MPLSRQPIDARFDGGPIAIDGTDAQFGDGDADKRAAGDRLEPARFDEFIRVEDQVLDDVEMYPQRLRKIGVGGRQPDEQVESLTKRRAEPAVFLRDAKRPEPGFLQKSDLVKGQRAVSFSIHRAGGDLFEDGRETRSQFIIAQPATLQDGEGSSIKISRRIVERTSIVCQRQRILVA